MTKEPKIFEQVRELENEMKKLDKRFDKLSHFRGVYLTDKYVNLKQDVENTVSRVLDDGEIITNKVTGLTRKLKGINTGNIYKLFEYTKIYSPELDKSFTLKQLQNKTLEWVPLERGQGNVRNQSEAINNAKREYLLERPSLPPIESTSEVYYSDAILERVWDECNKKGRTERENSPWEEITRLIQVKIDELGYENVARTFEENANQISISGDMNYETAVDLYDAMQDWDWLDLDLDTNKELTNGSELDYGFTEI